MSGIVDVEALEAAGFLKAEVDATLDSKMCGQRVWIGRGRRRSTH